MEWIVGTLVVLGFIAIIVRFMPRDDGGSVVLPTVVDNSIGMWALRRLTHRPLLERADDIGAADLAARAGPAVASGVSTAGERAGLSGRTTVASARFMASSSRLEALGIRPAGGARRSASSKPHYVATPIVSSSVRRRPQAHPTGPLAAQRRLAAILAILVLVVLAIVVAVVPRGAGGEVRGETGRPGISASIEPPASGLAVQPLEPLDSSSPPIEPTPVPPARPTAAGATPAPTPTIAPRVTPRPTARPTPIPKPKPPSAPPPTATPAPVATPTPTPAPTPTPTVPPAPTDTPAASP
jgi:hypothetical protein